MKIGPSGDHLPASQPGKQVENEATARLENSTSSDELDSRRAIALRAEQSLNSLIDRFERSGEGTKSGTSSKVAYDKETVKSNRLDSIREKIANGFYDRPEIREEIVNRILKEVDLEQEDEPGF